MIQDIRKVLITTQDETTNIAIISPEGRARDIYAAIQESLEACGGDSPKIVTAKTTTPQQKVINTI